MDKILRNNEESGCGEISLSYPRQELQWQPEEELYSCFGSSLPTKGIRVPRFSTSRSSVTSDLWRQKEQQQQQKMNNKGKGGKKKEEEVGKKLPQHTVWWNENSCTIHDSGNVMGNNHGLLTTFVVVAFRERAFASESW